MLQSIRLLDLSISRLGAFALEVFPGFSKRGVLEADSGGRAASVRAAQAV